MGAKKPSPSSPKRSSPARSKAGSGAVPAGEPAAPAGAGDRRAERPGRGAASRGGAKPARASLPIAPEALLERCEHGAFPATLYLEGPDEGVKAALLKDLRQAWARACPEAPAARVFRASETGIDELLAAFHGGSLFSPRELLMVLEIEDLGRSERRVAALADGLRRPVGGTSMVLVESSAETPRKSLEPLRAACAARTEAMPPRRASLLAWGTRRLAGAGIAPGPGTIEAVVDSCEGDATVFFDEIEKLAAWAGPGGRLTPADVAAVLRPVVGADLPGYLAAVAAGDPPLAARRLGDLLAAGVGEGTVLFSLANLVGGAMGGWARYRETSGALQRRLAPPSLARCLDGIYRAEAAWKGGRADAVAVLEQATRLVAGAVSS